MSYTATIGLEIHAELATKSKMFCGCKNEPHGSEPNSHICPVCLAHPGTLPVPNETAIEMVLRFGTAIGASLATFSEFDRKNYFYPDIPKAYQISQYAYPLLSGGELAEVALTRVHLEEDTARSQHDTSAGSLVDFNRAGVPLMELVTEPVIHDAETAGSFARELQLLLRTLNISQANMERGEMRVEANISVSQTSEFGTKVEVKNLNSFRSVESAISYEIARQIELLEQGGTVTQETRGWDEQKERTFSQRSKETAKDYRYFPDPDIPKLNVLSHEVFTESRLREKIPQLPAEKRLEYSNLGLPSEVIETIIQNHGLDEFFRQVHAQQSLSLAGYRLAANYLTSDIVSLLSDGKHSLRELKPDHFIELIKLLEEKKLGSRGAKDLLPELFGATDGPLALATERNMLQQSDPDALRPIISDIITENPTVVDDYRNGKEAALQFLVGQGMKKTKGAADPALLRELLLAEIQPDS
ncbi:MAG: Asp-tRNA(Asn)/Glu-tRNA(Gln) amidotransferase subunit GatB [Patescibacteria group bacterium]